MRRRLTADTLALAYECKQSGVTVKAISYGLGITASYLGALILKAEREGISAALDHRRAIR